MARINPTGKPNQVQTYTLFGFPQAPTGALPAVQNGPVTLTATHTIINLLAGDVDFGLDFFSPVSPKNYVRHSLPYSYLTVKASSSSEHDVEIFSSIDSTWFGVMNPANGSLTANGRTNMFEISDPHQIQYEERGDMAQWGTVVYASQPSTTSNLTSQCGDDQQLYQEFIKTGAIGQRTPFDCSQGDLYAHSHSIPECKGTCSINFAIGHYREHAVDYTRQPQTGYFRSKLPDIPTSVNAFFADYPAALSESHSLDSLIHDKGVTVSSNYADILKASVRQTFGAMELTIPADTLATDNQSVNVFLKEISSNGDAQTIDVIYPTFPFLYLLCPDWISMLLKPILSYLIKPPPVWTQEYAIHDLGFYPNATGHSDNVAEFMPVESTGQLLTLLLIHANATGDFSFYKRFTGPEGKYTLERNADFLVRTGLNSSRQLSTVDALPERANQTQLAIQAAIGVSAFGALTGGNNNYTVAGARMTQEILSNSALGAIRAGGNGSRHFTYSFDEPDSWSVMFPLFTDAVLNLGGENSFQPAYSMQNAFYSEQLAQTPAGLSYGRLDGKNIPWGITDWNLWAAAIADDRLKGEIVDTTWKFLMNGMSDVPFGTKYLVSEGQGKEEKGVGRLVGNKARSTVGGNFAILVPQGRKGWDDWDG